MLNTLTLHTGFELKVHCLTLEMRLKSSLNRNMSNVINVNHMMSFRDHSGGNREWRRRYEGIRVYGNPIDNVPDHTL